MFKTQINLTRNILSPLRNADQKLCNIPCKTNHYYDLNKKQPTQPTKFLTNSVFNAAKLTEQEVNTYSEFSLFLFNDLSIYCSFSSLTRFLSLRSLLYKPLQQTDHRLKVNNATHCTKPELSLS